MLDVSVIFVLGLPHPIEPIEYGGMDAKHEGLRARRQADARWRDGDERMGLAGRFP
jgi:hypothetical protein